MSAFSHTSWTVYCNGPGCKEQCTDDGIGGRDATRAGLRKYLARTRGWTVNVDAAKRGDGDDFCPVHKPAPAPQCAACGSTTDLIATDLPSSPHTHLCADTVACMARQED